MEDDNNSLANHHDHTLAGNHARLIYIMKLRIKFAVKILGIISLSLR